MKLCKSPALIAACCSEEEYRGCGQGACAKVSPSLIAPFSTHYRVQAAYLGKDESFVRNLLGSTVCCQSLIIPSVLYMCWTEIFLPVFVSVYMFCVLRAQQLPLYSWSLLHPLFSQLGTEPAAGGTTWVASFQKQLDQTDEP